MWRSEEHRTQEVVNAAIHENVVDAEAALRSENPRRVCPALGDEEAPGLEHETRSGESRLHLDALRDFLQALSKKSEIQRPFSLRIGNPESASEINGAQGNVEFLRK